MKPDDKFGNPHHSVTIIVDAELQGQLDSAMQELNGNKINGLKTDTETGQKLIRFKNVLKAREGISQFPVLDSEDKLTDTIPFGTDKVRVKVTPSLIERDGSVSFYMDKIQLVERNYEGGSGSDGGMGKVEGGYVATEETTPVTTASEDDTPF